MKYSKMEKTLIMSTNDNYNTYKCQQHGVFLKRKDVDDGKCPYKSNCGVDKISDIEKLKSQFMSELKK
jgi:hypothetical protein